MEILRQKWSFYFTLLDVDHDGVITKDDVAKILKRIPEGEDVTEAVGNVVTTEIENWWMTFILKGKDKVSEDDFLEDFEKQFTEDKQKFLKTVTEMETDIVKTLFVDKSKSVTLDSYANGFKIFGHDREDVLRKSFELFKPDRGMIPLQEFIDDWVLFLTNEDSTKQDVILETFLFWTKEENEI